jgi:3-dehydroquinate synthase
MNDTIFFYGPPGCGKSTIGRILAQNLDRPFFDLDGEIETHSGRAIPEIFAAQGEPAFRELENREIERLLTIQEAVIALGGGALTTPATRALAEARGRIICLNATPEVLLARVQADAIQRPLLAGDAAAKLSDLLDRRADHYAGFPLQIDTTHLTPGQSSWEAQILLGQFRVRGMGQPYDVYIQPGGLDKLGAALTRRGLRGPVALVTDTNVGPLYAPRAAASLQIAGLSPQIITLPAGEASKRIETIQRLWEGFLACGVERGSTIIALGGGVVGDLTGFAAATYLRGVAWVNAPTTLLAMADASLGGKTGADLPQGKNLIGAFHPPALVLADSDVLATLPEAEFRSGMAEIVKHGIIADPALFEMCGRLTKKEREQKMGNSVARAMAVKIGVIETDPYERGWRAALNLGHTIGHAIELASGFSLRHGEAVAIGTVVEARLAERLGLTSASIHPSRSTKLGDPISPKLAIRITQTLRALGLPTDIPPTLDRAEIWRALGVDKKKSGGAVRFTLPVEIGEVQVGVSVPEEVLRSVIR